MDGVGQLRATNQVPMTCEQVTRSQDASQQTAYRFEPVQHPPPPRATSETRGDRISQAKPIPRTVSIISSLKVVEKETHTSLRAKSQL